MCTSLSNKDTVFAGGVTRDFQGKRIPTPLKVSFDRPLNATDIPLGNGILDAASLSLRTRRTEIRAAEGK